jgi:nucleotide-binding universal stress UspA family protein
MGIARSEDWKLIRNSSTPLMLVTETQWQSHGHLLTAIETEENSPPHNALNKDILEHSYRLSEKLTSKIHLVNCYLGEDPSISVTPSSSGMNFISQKELHWQHLKMLSGNNLDIDQELHLQQGIPETEISLMAKKYNVNMVIIGAAEHNNLVANIFGHTSEYIIDELQCDVLAVQNYVTHH